MPETATICAILKIIILNKKKHTYKYLFRPHLMQFGDKLPPCKGEHKSFGANDGFHVLSQQAIDFDVRSPMLWFVNNQNLGLPYICEWSSSRTSLYKSPSLSPSSQIWLQVLRLLQGALSPNLHQPPLCHQRKLRLAHCRALSGCVIFASWSFWLEPEATQQPLVIYRGDICVKIITIKKH